MPAVWWTALKKSLSCKSKDACDVIKRDDSQGSSARGLKKSFLRSPSSLSSSLLRRLGCSRSISNLREVIRSQYGSSQQQEWQAPTVLSGCTSPRSIGSDDVQNAVTHDVLLAARGSASGREVRTGTPGRGAWMPFQHSPLLMQCDTTPLSQRKSPRAPSPLRREGGADYAEDRLLTPAGASCEFGVRCRRCGDRVANDDALEWHHFANHAVTELVEDDSARGVVEIICTAGWPNPETALDRVERIVKIHNAERSVARYEEFRKTVMGRAAQLPKKHPRCIADGNELLQFHGTTVSCSLGAGGSSSLCTPGRCNVCRIIRHGFSATTEAKDGGVSVFTTSTSKRALECIQETSDGAGDEAGEGSVKHALLVCRVIAGRIHRALENVQDVATQPGFDSFAGKMSADSTVEELYLLNPRALLPCYVVIYKP